jgi:hypothetical protein
MVRCLTQLSWQRSPEQHIAPSVQEQSRHVAGGFNPRREPQAPVSPVVFRKTALSKLEAVLARC